jgi:2-dehydro-3-deoxygluconokinase
MSAPALLCLGEPMLELNRAPAGADGRPAYLEGHGGDTSNAAICAARQGAPVGYLTAIGEDGPGQSFLDLWHAEGIDTAQVIRRAGAPTALYLVTHDAGGHAFAFYRQGSAASTYGPADVPAAAIQAARILHVSGISQAISTSACDAVFHAIEIARAAGVAVSYDTNFRPRLWPAARAAAVMHAAMARAEIALPSLEDARVLTGLERPEAIAEFYLRLGSGIVVVKLGAAGALLALADGTRALLPPHRVAAVDATGAGDAFAGAFLARHLAGDPPLAAARYANAAAALSTTGYGAVAPLPRPEAVRALLAAG